MEPLGALHHIVSNNAYLSDDNLTRENLAETLIAHDYIRAGQCWLSRDDLSCFFHYYRGNTVYSTSLKLCLKKRTVYSEMNIVWKITTLPAVQKERVSFWDGTETFTAGSGKRGTFMNISTFIDAMCKKKDLRPINGRSILRKFFVNGNDLVYYDLPTSTLMVTEPLFQTDSKFAMKKLMAAECIPEETFFICEIPAYAYDSFTDKFTYMGQHPEHAMVNGFAALLVEPNMDSGFMHCICNYILEKKSPQLLFDVATFIYVIAYTSNSNTVIDIFSSLSQQEVLHHFHSLWYVILNRPHLRHLLFLILGDDCGIITSTTHSLSCFKSILHYRCHCLYKFQEPICTEELAVTDYESMWADNISKDVVKRPLCVNCELDFRYYKDTSESGYVYANQCIQDLNHLAFIFHRRECLC